VEDFNAKRVDKVCDIFAPTLRADVDGFPERTFRPSMQGAADYSR
jgi:hypothetical protein